MSEQNEQQRTAQHDRRARGRHRVPLAPDQGPDGIQRRQGAQADVQTRRPVVLAEESLADGGGPVLQRRLLDVDQSVQVRYHPVAAGEHLTRNLRIAALVGIVETALTQTDQPPHHEQAQQ